MLTGSTPDDFAGHTPQFVQNAIYFAYKTVSASRAEWGGHSGAVLMQLGPGQRQDGVSVALLDIDPSSGVTSLMTDALMAIANIGLTSAFPEHLGCAVFCEGVNSDADTERLIRATSPGNAMSTLIDDLLAIGKIRELRSVTVALVNGWAVSADLYRPGTELNIEVCSPGEHCDHPLIEPLRELNKAIRQPAN